MVPRNNTFIDFIAKGFVDVPLDPSFDIILGIQKLRQKKNIVILAHYYQDPAIQDIADFIGDSLALSQQAEQTNADIILFAGVHFMAETAKILNPKKKVLLPDLKSGCSLADSCEAADLAAFKLSHPDHVVVTYINCSAEVKALSDIICTSANAERIINSIPLDKPILFAPDKNLGKYLIHKTGRDMDLWEGACLVHEAFSIDKLVKLHLENPDACIIAHPESESSVLKVARYIGSTAGMLDFVKRDSHKKFIVATEAGILHQMQKAVPTKIFIAAPVYENTRCACSECGFMRMNTLQKVYLTMKYELPEITLSGDLSARALVPLQKMLNLSRN